MMQYKGYSAKVEYDEDAKLLYGRVLGIRDVVDFQAKRVEEVEKEFHRSVNDYLAFCAKRSESPDKPLSGKLVFRTTPDNHRLIAIAAEKEGLSINQFLEQAALQQVQH
jgi:predicted HicB family RNase H-like nuclease